MSKTTRKKADTDKHATRQKAKAPERKKLVIKRSEWARGKRCSTESRIDYYSGKKVKDTVPIDNLLLGEDGMKCCLGFLALSCKISRKDIDNRSTPSCALSTNRWPEWLVEDYSNTDACSELMKANDDVVMNWQTREKKIRDEMAKHGVDVKFVP